MGAPTPKVGMLTYFFAENCMKIKEFGAPGSTSMTPPKSKSKTFCVSAEIDFLQKNLFLFILEDDRIFTKVSR